MPPSFLLLFAGLLIGAKVVGWCSQKLGMPSVLGQLVVGILIGPSLLGWVHSNLVIETFSNIGVIILMFIAGLETDTKQMRQVGRVAFFSASLGVILPLVAGTLFALSQHHSAATSLFLGTLLTATSVSISAQTLKDLGKLTSKEGTTILGAAVIDDVLGLLVLSAMLAFTLGQPRWSILKMAIYFPVSFIIGRYLFPLLSHWLPACLPLRCALGSSSHWSSAMPGLRVAGQRGGHHRRLYCRCADETTDMRVWGNGHVQLGYSLFIPFFFVGIGIQATFQGIWASPSLIWFSLGLIPGIVTKVVGVAAERRLLGLAQISFQGRRGDDLTW